MAVTDSSTPSNIVMLGHIWPPKIKIPDNAVEDEKSMGLVFDIQTRCGTVSVRGCRKWGCSGTVNALTAAGLLLPEWAPGLPGNNKTRQTVVFADGIPRLVRGNRRGTALPGPFIVIERRSRYGYCVRVEPTKEQYALLDAVVDRHWEKHRAQLDAERKEQVMAIQAARRKAMPKDEIRRDCLNFVEITNGVVMALLNSGSYRPDAKMARDMNDIFAKLEKCILEGELLPEYLKHGNVVPLHRDCAR